MCQEYSNQAQHATHTPNSKATEGHKVQEWSETSEETDHIFGPDSLISSKKYS